MISEMLPGLVNYLVVLLILSGTLAGLLHRSNTGKRLSIVVGGAFLVRVGYGTIDDHLGLLAYQGDFTIYDSLFWQVAQTWRQGQFFQVFEISTDMIFHTLVHAPVYAIFGHETVLVRLVAAFVGALFVWNVARIATVVGDRKAGLFVGGFAAVYPYWICLSGIFYRDMLTMLLLSQMIYTLLCWIRKETLAIEAIASVVFAGLALSLRLPNFVPIGAVFATVVGIKIYQRKTPESIGISFGTALGGSAALLLNEKVKSLLNKASVTRLSSRRRHLARGYKQGAYLPEVLYDNVVELVAFLPMGIAYFLFTPFPWQTEVVTTWTGAAAFVQNVLLWYPATILALVGTRHLAVKRPKDLLVLSAYILPGILLYGLVEGNVGPSIRHRSQFQFCIIVLSGVAAANLVRLDVSDRFDVSWRLPKVGPMNVSNDD